MSKRKRSAGRGTSATSNLRLHGGSVSVFDDLHKALSPIGADRRQWHPEDAPTYNPARYLSGAPARIVISRPAKPLFRPSKAFLSPVYSPTVSLPSTVRYEAPKAVAVCVRRKQRKEVLHAKGKAGGRVSKPKMNVHSSTRCK